VQYLASGLDAKRTPKMDQYLERTVGTVHTYFAYFLHFDKMMTKSISLSKGKKEGGITPPS